MGKVKSKFNILNLKKAYRYFKKNGLREVYHASKERMNTKTNATYSYEKISEKMAEQQCKTSFLHNCKISIIVPAYETKEEYLQEMITSVINQTYSNWQLIIADASSTNVVFNAMKKFNDNRIDYFRLEENAGISENSNEALKRATGEYVGLLDHDDTLSRDALHEVASVINLSSPQMIYSDEDKTNATGTIYFEPHYKLDFNLDLLLTNNYICHFLVISGDVIKDLGFRKEYNGAQDFDLALRTVERILPNQIVHIPKVLYHWRCHEASTAANPASKMYAYEAGLRAVEDYLKNNQIEATVTHSKHLGFYKVTYEESIFSQRKEVAAIGGPIVKKGKIVGGAMTQDGKVLYSGLNKHFSGYMNRGVLMQDVEALDISCINIRKELQPIYIEVKETIDNESRDFSFEKSDFSVEKQDVEQEKNAENYSLAISLETSKRLRQLGYLLVYDPSMEVSTNE